MFCWRWIIPKKIYGIFLVLLYAGLAYAAPDTDPFGLPENSIAPKQNLSSSFLNIHYASSVELAKFLSEQKPSLLSSEGHIKADARTNILWVQDSTERISLIKSIVDRLDIPVKQILIKARIVNIDERYLKNLGINFGSTQSSSNQTGLSMDFPNGSTQNGQFTIPIAKLMNDQFIDLQLNALEQSGHAHIISSPELITSNRLAATLQSGEEIPYQEQTISGNTSLTFKKALLKLKVTPAVMPKAQILLQLEVNQDKISTLTVQGVPAIRTQELSTEVLLKNNETVVLGGIYEESDHHQVSGVPILSKIPLLGLLFQDHQQRHERKKLLIFVTPVIL